MTISIRKPTIAEYSRIAAVINTREERIMALYDQSEYWDNFGPVTTFSLESAAGLHAYRVAEVDGTIVGFISYYQKENGVMWIGDIVVIPELQRQGIGTKLVEYVRNEALRAGAPAMALETQDRFSWAVAFCESLGFSRIDAVALGRPPYAGTLVKPPVRGAVVYGRVLP